MRDHRICYAWRGARGGVIRCPGRCVLRKFPRLGTAEAWCAAWGLGRGAWAGPLPGQVWEVGGCGVEVEVEGKRYCYCGRLGDGGRCWCWVRVRVGGLGGGVVAPALVLILILGLGGYLLRAGLDFFSPRLGDPEVL